MYCESLLIVITIEIFFFCFCNIFVLCIPWSIRARGRKLLNVLSILHYLVLQPSCVLKKNFTLKFERKKNYIFLLVLFLLKWYLRVSVISVLWFISNPITVYLLIRHCRYQVLFVVNRLYVCLVIKKHM